MIDKALFLFGQVTSSLIAWFGQITIAIPGSSQLIIAAFFIYSTFQIILKPLYRGGSSDLVINKGSSDKKTPVRSNQARLSGRKGK